LIPRPEARRARGDAAEERACRHLDRSGLTIVERNFRTRGGEIDIIAARRHTLIFVEVKARANLDDAAEAVTERQKQRIVAAAEVWLAANPMPAIRDMRFDAILVAPGKLPRHIKAAFES